MAVTVFTMKSQKTKFVIVATALQIAAAVGFAGCKASGGSTLGDPMADPVALKSCVDKKLSSVQMDRVAAVKKVKTDQAALDQAAAKLSDANTALSSAQAAETRGRTQQAANLAELQQKTVDAQATFDAAQTDRDFAQKASDDSSAALEKTPVVADSFGAAAASCNMSELSQAAYLADTNVKIGVQPDSVEDTTVKSGDRLASTSTNQVGYAKDVYTDGSINLRWDESSYDSKTTQGGVSREVFSRHGITSGIIMISRDTGQLAIASEVFASGQTRLRYDGNSYDSYLNASKLDPEVNCLDQICQGAKVISHSTARTGTAVHVFANGQVSVRYDSTSYDSMSKTSDLAGRI